MVVLTMVLGMATKMVKMAGQVEVQEMNLEMQKLLVLAQLIKGITVVTQMGILVLILEVVAEALEVPDQTEMRVLVMAVLD